MKDLGTGQPLPCSFSPLSIAQSVETHIRTSQELSSLKRVYLLLLKGTGRSMWLGFITISHYLFHRSHSFLLQGWMKDIISPSASSSYIMSLANRLLSLYLKCASFPFPYFSSLLGLSLDPFHILIELKIPPVQIDSYLISIILYFINTMFYRPFSIDLSV